MTHLTATIAKVAALHGLTTEEAERFLSRPDVRAREDGGVEIVADAETAKRRRSIMLAVHEKAARAFATHGNTRNAQQAQAVADRLRAQMRGLGEF